MGPRVRLLSHLKVSENLFWSFPLLTLLNLYADLEFLVLAQLNGVWCVLFRPGGTSHVWSMYTQIISTNHFTVCFNCGFWQCLFLGENGESQWLQWREAFIFSVSSWYIHVALLLSTAAGAYRGRDCQKHFNRHLSINSNRKLWI